MPNSTRCWAAVLAVLLVTLAAPGAARAANDEPEAFARVTVDAADIRTGPGVSFRVIYTAERGETLALDGRPGAGFWLRVILPDGRSGYALGDEVEPFSVNPKEPGAPSRPGIFAPPPLQGSRVGLAILGGLISTQSVETVGLERYGYLEVRPSILVHKTLSIDGFLGDALTSDGAELLYGGGASVYFAPSWPVCPFLSLDAGGLSVIPNSDSFVLTQRNYYVARAGGGLLLALRGRILIRLEVTNLSIFVAGGFSTPQPYQNAQTYAGGFGVYF
jgi:SH3 domain-containing protein